MPGDTLSGPPPGRTERLGPVPRHAYEALSSELEVLIRGGHFAVGDRLPSERQLAQEFGVSRPTVRAALGQLESRGLLVTRSGRGSFVAATRPSRVDDGLGPVRPRREPAHVLEARLVVEVALARLAARRAPHDREGLDQVRCAVEALERVADPRRFPAELERDFHQSVVALTGNPVLIELGQSASAAMADPTLVKSLQAKWSTEATRRMAGEHRAIYEALRAGDSELVAFAVERHLRSLAVALLDESAVDGPPPRFYA